MKPDADNTVLLATFPDTIQANLARDRLEDAGISSFLSDQHMVNAHPLLGSAIGGVKLWVSESQAADATEVLEQASDDEFDFGEDEPLDDEDKLPSSMPLCPNCGSKDIGFGTLFYVFVAIVILSFAVPFVTPLDPGDGFILALALGFVGMWGLILRKFPLRCGECGETGAREHFEGNLPKDA